MRITQKQIEAAYKVAVLVFLNKVERRVGAQLLGDKHGMNFNSAQDFIGVYRHMREGSFRNRWLGASATEYYLRQIESTDGRPALLLAIKATRKYMAHNPGRTWGRLRDVVERFSQSSLPLADLEAKFDAAVKRAAKDPAAARQKRLLQRVAKSPSRVKATTYVFVRDPDVVAEVLFRAAGICEGCGKTAPFLRKKDGMPYLEVHHKIQLVNGGEDSIRNAIALCPNCHRRSHFGID